MQYHSSTREAHRAIFTALISALNIDLKDASFLDLGPGYGDTLDLAREAGAKTVEFIDYDPYIMTFNILKGFKGYMFDYTFGKGLTQLYPRKYDVILSKGSINADQFNRKEPRMIRFPEWIKQVENLANPNGQIIICPTFDKGTEMCEGSYYVCKDPEAFRQSWFTKVLLDRGYEILYIEGFNKPKERFPFTFYKKMS